MENIEMKEVMTEEVMDEIATKIVYKLKQERLKETKQAIAGTLIVSGGVLAYAKIKAAIMSAKERRRLKKNASKYITTTACDADTNEDPKD